MKLINNLRAGCSNWQPDEVEDTTSLENIKNQLFTLTEDNENFFVYLEKTYAQQRLFLNSTETPTVNQIREQYPFLTNSKAAIYWHFKKLMNIDIESIDILKKSEKIVQFFDRKSSETPKSITQHVVVESLKNLAEYFKDDIGYLLREFKVKINKISFSEHIFYIYYLFFLFQKKNLDQADIAAFETMEPAIAILGKLFSLVFNFLI